MAITLKDRAELAAQLGVQPWEVDIKESPDGSVTVTPARKVPTEGSALGTAARYVAGNAPGAVVGTTAGVAAMETVAPLVNTTAEALRGIPRIGAIAAPVAKFVGNALTFGAGASGGKYLAEEHSPLGAIKDLAIGGDKQEALDAAKQPWAMRTGEFLSNFAGQKVPDVKSLATGLPKVGTFRRLATGDLGLTTAESAAVQNLGGGMALGGAQEVVRELAAGEDLSPTDIAVNTLLGGVFGDARSGPKAAGESIARGLKSLAPGARAKPVPQAIPTTAEPTGEKPLADAELAAIRDDVVKQMAARQKLTTAEQVANAKQAMGASKILDMDRGEYVRRKLETEIRNRTDMLPEDVATALSQLAKIPGTELAQFHDDFQSLGRTAQADQQVKEMLSGPASEAQVQANIKRTLEPVGPPAPEPRLTTADVAPEAPLAGPSTRELVQKFLPNKPTSYTQRPARPGEGAGKPRQVDYTFGQGPEDPVTLEHERLQNELEGRRVRYQEEAEAEANAAGRAIEGLALSANPMMAPAALLRGRGETTAEPAGFEGFKTQMRAQGLPADVGAEIPGAKALERRGFSYTPAAQPIMTPQGRRARGSFTPETGEIAIDPTVANATTAKHEGMHAELQDMLLSGNPKLERLATEMVAIAGEEPLAEGGAVASNAQEKTNRLLRLLKDNWNWLRTSGLPLVGGDQSPERLARVLAERFDFQAPGPVKTGAAGAKFQPTDDRTFVSGTEAFLRRGAPGLTFTREGRITPESFNAWLAKQPRAEQELMAQAGLADVVNRGATADELVAHLRERGPRVDVLDYGMTGKASSYKTRLDGLMHEFDSMPANSPVRNYAYTITRHGRTEGDLQQFTKDVAAGVTGGELTQQDAVRLRELINLKRVVNAEPIDTSPRATSAYKSVSAHDPGAPMPEWTVSKLPNNVQRVDVAIPRKEVSRQTMDTSGKYAYAAPDERVGNELIYKEAPLWRPDNTHENVPNTLGWAMIQYTTGPKGEKIAHIAEAQSRWGQQRRGVEAGLPKNAELITPEGMPPQWKVSYADPNEAPIYVLQETAPTREAALKWVVDKYHPEDTTTPGHQLLSDYNRLILKAAVAQARKEGATHIAISDAETAMMTEMHDQYAARPAWNGNYDRPYATRAEAEAAAAAISPDLETSVERAAGDRKYYVATRPRTITIEQEGGMRFNYDKALPKIAEEMLGPGQRVSLGEHKNAYTKHDGLATPMENYERSPLFESRYEAEDYARQHGLRESTVIGTRADGYYVETIKPYQRSNLIFRNPDGTPKTDVSATMFPIDAMATRLAAGEPMTLTGKRYQEMTGADEFQTVPHSVLDVPDKVVAKAGYDFMADKARMFGETANVAIAKAKKAGGEKLWFDTMNKRSDAFDRGTQPNYTPEEAQMALIQQELYDKYAQMRNAAGLPGNNAPNYTGHLADINVIKEAEADYPAFAAKHLPEYLHYNATQYGPAQVKGFDPVEAAQTFRDYFTGAARAPHSEFGADFGVLTKSARQYGLPPSMRAPYDFRHAMRFGERFTRGLAEKRHLKDNPHVAKMLGLDDGGSPAGEIYRDFRSALAGQLPNQGKTSAFSDAGELYDAARQTVNTAIMQAPTGLWNTLSKVKDYGVVMAQNPEIGVKALVDATGDLLSNFGALRQEAISVDAIRPGQDYIGANENLNVAGNVARNMRNFNMKARMVTGTEAIEQFNRVQDYAFGKKLAEAALALRRSNDPAAADFWKRFGAGIDDTMPDAEIIKRAAGNFVRDIQGSYGPEGLPAWLLNSSTPSLLMRLNRFGWENMRRVQRQVIEPARNGNWLPLLTYIGLAGVTAEVRKQLADALLKQPSGLPTAEEIEAAGAEPAIEQTLNLMEMADAAGAFGFMGSAAGAVAKNVRGTKRAVVMDPTINFGWQLVQNLAAAADAMKEGEEAGPVVQEVLKRTLLDNIQNLRPLAADRGEAVDRRNKKVFSDLTDRKKVTTGAVLQGLALGSLTQPGRKIDPTMDAARKGEPGAYKSLSKEERRLADNYAGGYEDDKTERQYRKFIEAAQGGEALEDYMARRREYKRQVRQP